jgi:hypothetical protein
MSLDTVYYEMAQIAFTEWHFSNMDFRTQNVEKYVNFDILGI